MVRAASAGARQIMEEWLATRHTDIAEGFRAAQALFGPGDWIGFQGDGDGELRALLVAQRGAVARKSIDRARAP